MGLLKTTHNHFVSKEYVPYEKTVIVHEHKAPTDESVKLLNEMQDKALKNILAQIPIESNVMKGCVIFMHDDIVWQKISLILKFNLNGENFEIHDQIEKREFEKIADKSIRDGSSYVIEYIHERFSKIIAAELMNQSRDFFKLLIP